MSRLCPAQPHPLNRDLGLLTLIAVLFALFSPTLADAHPSLDLRLERISRHIEEDSHNPALYYERATYWILNGSTVAAFQDLNQALACDPTHRPSRLARATLKLEAGDAAGAMEDTSWLLDRDPLDPGALKTHGRVMVRMRNYAEAIATYEKLLQVSRSVDDVLEFIHVLTLPEINEPERALAVIERALSEHGSVMTLELEALELERHLARFDPALQRIDRLMSEANRLEWWLVQKGEVLEKKGDMAGARDAYQDALAAIRSLPPSRGNTAFVFELQNKIEMNLQRINLPMRRNGT